MAKNEKAPKPAVKKKVDEEKKKALNAVFEVIEKEYGKGSIMKLGDTTTASVDAIPNGVFLRAGWESLSTSAKDSTTIF